MGWALHQPKTGSVRFSENVRRYLVMKFDIGERTGNKSNPSDVEADMRTSRNENNERRFTREEWLTTNQIKSFFSRLCATRRKQGQIQRDMSMPIDDQDDKEQDLAEERAVIEETLGLKHPVVYDVYGSANSTKKTS